tara:strand:+ start:160 stop:291 length:132 start_codon:yes stop_codon:yes gene_type:complete
MIRDEEELNSDDFYDSVEQILEDDAISAWEEGFINGYMSELEE